MIYSLMATFSKLDVLTRFDNWKLILFFYRRSQLVNVLVSMVVGWIGYRLEKDFLWSFSLSLTTMGFVFSLFLFEMSNKASYYFYYNKGISKMLLLGVCWFINFVLFISSVVLKTAAHG